MGVFVCLALPRLLFTLLFSLGTFPISESALWSRTAKNTDCSTEPLARPFARSLAPLTRPLAPDCSLRSRPPLRSLVRSLAHFAHSLAHGKVNYRMSILCFLFVFFSFSTIVIWFSYLDCACGEAWCLSFKKGERQKQKPCLQF